MALFISLADFCALIVADSSFGNPDAFAASLDHSGWLLLAPFKLPRRKTNSVMSEFVCLFGFSAPEAQTRPLFPAVTYGSF
jgi:hypothetical protein